MGKGRQTPNKLNKEAEAFVVDCLVEDVPYPKIQQDLKEFFHVEISLPAITNKKKKFLDEIARRKTDYYRSEVVMTPLAHQGYRMLELWQMYKNSRTQSTKLHILDLARKECGLDNDRIVKIFNIVNQRVNENHVHFNFGGADNDERKRIAAEFAGLLGEVGGADPGDQSGV